MSGVHRFLSKREGKHHHHVGKKNSTSRTEVTSGPVDLKSPADFYGLFDSPQPASPVEEPKVKVVRQRIIHSKGVMMRDAQILWALRSPMSNGGDVDATFDLLLAMSDAAEGILTGYDPARKLLGAQNRQGVTCFLDATLFSMFSRLDSFEAMLYNSFDDVSRNKLGFVLRLWVNLLRSGKLITTDLTKVMQEILAECGWKDAAELHQQDASEAFTFITEKLELPLLTLKMDIYHTGREEASDDHKFINERLLEVAIPPDPTGERKDITLEDCLEEYFNNRIEVRRYLERRGTINSIRSLDIKGQTNSVHVETVEVDSDSSPVTPTSSSPSFASPMRPSVRHRAPSIIQERYIPPRRESGYSSLAKVDTRESAARSRAGSIRKEVMMPAWQFFSLIPWYTDHAPKNDAQVAAHFSTKRPVLGLCLKRYSMTTNGKAIRLDTHVDIPVEIGLPHFIQDDQLDDDGPLYGNFKLSLQSVVCHRGSSVHSGHYIALVRGSPTQAEESKSWLRFDDLAPQRITAVDIEQALRDETPYLLFYQIMPIDGDPGHITTGEDVPPSPISERNGSVSGISSLSITLTQSSTGDNTQPASGQPASGRPSLEVQNGDDVRGRSPVDSRSTSTNSFVDQGPGAPNEGPAGGYATSETSSRSHRFSASLNRTQSKTNDSLGRTLARLTGKQSRETLPEVTISEPEVHVREIVEPEQAAKREASGQMGGLGVNQSKGLKRDKSKSRLSRGASRVRGSKPDRECIVM